MGTLLFKTEPGEYSFDDLMREGSTPWEGVSNAAALKALRAAKRGNDVFIYHTGGEKRIVGLARVVRATLDEDGKTPHVEIAARGPLESPISLATIKADPRFKDFALVRQSRLSVMEVPTDVDQALRRLAGL